MFEPFSYRAWVKRLNWNTGTLESEGAVVDGDSTWLLFDRGVYEYHACNCRLWGVNTPELNSKDEVERLKAKTAKEWLKGQIEGKEVFVLSKGLDKYGRPLVEIYLNALDFGNQSKSVNQMLIEGGLGAAYLP